MSNRLDGWLAPLLGVAMLSAAVCEPQAREVAGEPELYHWLDLTGVVRYTPDLDRIPDTRRKTAIRVVPGTNPLGEQLSSSPAAPVVLAPLGLSLAGADPFNAPAEARRVVSEELAIDAAYGGNSWPELDARIAELEVLISADEEIIKDMISAPPSEGSDDLIHSPVLRQIAARLPILQGELSELRRWREQPRD
ncbi:MAG: hypothetical protein VCE43_16050 [Myxococcota bacterium]